MTREEKIEKIRTLVPRLRAAIDGLTPEQLTTQYNAPEWTIAQNIHHLVDSHAMSFLRFKMILTQDEAQMVGYDQDAFAALPDGSEANLEDSLTILEGLHARWARMLSHIKDWEKRGYHLEAQRSYTLDEMLDVYANHGDGHIQQIQEVLAKMP